MRSFAYGLVLLALLLTDCARFVATPRLNMVGDGGYDFDNLELGDHNTDEVFVVLSLSGGGTRAAALSYGVMQRLRETPLGEGEGALLHEVDVITSVSGGSFAAAYYGLFGEERFFSEFEDDVLHRKIQSRLIRSVTLKFWNWPRLWSPRFGRSDLVNEFYDHEIFDRRLFSDLPRERPFIILNASDMSMGAQFSFTQSHFDRICADLGSVQVSRAVLASSAFPGAFTPVTWVNHAGAGCGYETPEWVELSLGEDPVCREDPGCRGDLFINPRRYNEALNWSAYRNVESKPYVHTVDGGLADNIGLRAVIPALTTSDGPWSVLRNIEQRGIQHVAVIVVDAKPRKKGKRDRKISAPGLTSVFWAAATKPMANYSTDTVELLRNRFKQWEKLTKAFHGQRRLCDDAAASLCDGNQRLPQCVERESTACYERFRVSERFRPPDPELYHIHVNFEAIEDAKLRGELQEIPTSLQLPPATIQKLIAVGADLLSASPEYQRLVRNLRSTDASGR